MSTRHETTNQATINPAAAVEIPLPASTWTPEAILEGLRAMSVHMGEVTPLTPRQRKTLRDRARASNAVVQASINVIGALDNVSQAVGQPAAEVRQKYEEVNRWTAVEGELRTMLSGVAGANLIRRQRVVLIAAQALSIGAQLSRDPIHAVLVPHVEEVRRLKRFTRRKKATQAPASLSSPAPGPLPPHGPDTSETSQG